MCKECGGVRKNCSSAFPESLQTRIKRFLCREGDQIVSSEAADDISKWHISSGELSKVINTRVGWGNQSTFLMDDDQEKEDGHLLKYQGQVGT